jgi:hypothetical protein
MILALLPDGVTAAHEAINVSLCIFVCLWLLCIQDVWAGHVAASKPALVDSSGVCFRKTATAASIRPCCASFGESDDIVWPSRGDRGPAGFAAQRWQVRERLVDWTGLEPVDEPHGPESVSVLRSVLFVRRCFDVVAVTPVLASAYPDGGMRKKKKRQRHSGSSGSSKGSSQSGAGCWAAGDACCAQRFPKTSAEAPTGVCAPLSTLRVLSAGPVKSDGTLKDLRGVVGSSTAVETWSTGDGMLKDPQGAAGLAGWLPAGKQGGGIGALGEFLCLVAIVDLLVCVVLRCCDGHCKVQSLCSGVGCCTVGCKSSRAFRVQECAPLTVFKTLSAVWVALVWQSFVPAE